MECQKSEVLAWHSDNRTIWCGVGWYCVPCRMSPVALGPVNRQGRAVTHTHRRMVYREVLSVTMETPRQGQGYCLYFSLP